MTKITQAEATLTAIKMYAKDKAKDWADVEAQLFYGELAAWATGMSTPAELKGPRRTHAIRAFFRGMKRQK